MHEIRVLLDTVVSMFPSLEENCSSHSRIDSYPQFESVICKIFVATSVG